MIALPGIAIQSKIYESSASLVYRGIRVKNEQAIIIKLLKQDYPSSQELICYRQEYEITRSLNLEGVIKAYSQQSYQRTLVILLEDFGGESLAYWMRQQSDFCPMSLPTFLQLAIALTDTLGKVHAANIIHKDINPGNIVLNCETGVVKLIDFGIATRFNRVNPTFKSPHVLEGTLAYLSPEQTGRMNRSLDYRTDFYSLGVTFYELLTGELPFTTTDSLELVHCHIAKQPVPPHELNATIPKPVSDVILKLMAKNAEDRYQSAWGIQADLEICANQLETIGQIGCIQLGLQDMSSQFQIPQKLYGREAEIAALLAAFEKVAAGVGAEKSKSRGVEANNPPFLHRELVLVSGYAGVGKSALVQELYKTITAKRGYFVSGKFDQFQRNIPYSAIAQALQKLVRQLLGEPEEQIHQWRSQLLKALGNNGQLIIEVIPEVELIIGPQQPVPEVGATEAQNRFNRVFQQFIRIFSSSEHPLVIFLDDLQWIDSATLRLVELIMTGAETQHLFLIGAYRDNEVSLYHPLIKTLEGLRQEGVRINQISLAPLELNAIAQLTADTLHTNLSTVYSLAELVLQKTGGNPFFVNEFLKTLYTKNLLSFNVEQLCWQWNIAQIEGENITDNVVELMLGKLKKLPTETQQVLQLAACIGADFDLSTLSIICDRSPNEIFSQLVTAVQFGLIVPISELDEQLFVQNYKFLHDRVQQAAYSLIEESQRQTVHLQIGRSLLENTLPEQRSNKLFEIVDHLNHGIEIVTNQVERDEFAKLNLIAGQKAKAAIAYSVAKNYLTTGRKWLDADSWRTNYDLTLDLSIETTEVAYLCGDFDQVKTWMDIVLQEVKTVLDIIKVYEVKIQSYIAQNQPWKAIDTALQILQQLGIDFPKKPSQLDIQLELDKITSLVSNQSIEDLSHLPAMTEPDKLAAMRILSSITIAGYIAAPELMPLLVSKQVNLSIQYGSAFASPFAYALCGLIVCGIVGNIELGYQFGQLALSQLSHPNTHLLRAKTLLFVNVFIIHRKEPVRAILQPVLEAYQSGLETGDLEFAAYCAYTYCLLLFIVGKELVEVECEMMAFSEVIRQLKQKVVLNWVQIFQQFVSSLRKHSVNPIDLVNEPDDKANRKPQDEKDGFALFLVYFSELFRCYLFSEYDQAVVSSTKAEKYLPQPRATPTIALYYFYDSLARLATYSKSSEQVQKEILKKIAVNQEIMNHWAQYAPMNYLHKYHLVQAETARALGQLFEAEEFYEQAIQEARDNDYLQEEALAYELAARFYLDRGREKFAQTYMKEAHYCYERWGATAKVNDLETRYPQFFSQPSNVQYTLTSTVSKTNSNHSSNTFDLEAVMKASQAISSEIELEELLHSLMQILIENAGAQTGCLILETSGNWLIEAACELQPGKNVCNIDVLRSLPTANRLPESIIQYVIRTRELVILDDASRNSDYENDVYIQQHQVRSLLCIPLLKQTKLVGVLYLENQLAAGAFTPERSQVLQLLSTQAAIAIENAQLYSKLRVSESRTAQFLEAIPVGVVVLDQTGYLHYFNQRASQLLGQGIDPTVPPDQLSEIYQLYRAGTHHEYPEEELPGIRALSGECSTVDDMEIYHSNGRIPVEVWGTPVFDEQGNVTYAIAAFQDITQRKQAETALQESEAKYRLLFEDNPNPMWIFDAQTLAFLMVNDAAIQYYGYSLDEFLGMTILDIRPSTDATRLIEHMDYLRSAPYTSSGEWQHCRKDGTVIDVEIISHPIAWSGIDARCVLVKDITERNRTERLLANYNQTLEQQVTERTLELEREKEALQQSEATNRAMISAIPDLLIRMNQDGTYLKVVRSGNFQPFNPQQLKAGVNVRDVLPPDIAQTRMEYTRQAIQTGELQVYEQKIVSDEQVFDQEVRIAAIGDGEVLVMIRDICDRKQAEEASILEERNRMAREIHDTLAQAFTSIIVHLDAASQRLTLDPNAAQAHLKTGRNLARSGLSDARRSVEALRPQILEEGDLYRALNRFATQMFNLTSIKVICEAIGDSYNLPKEVEINLLRIGQEALTNAFKYANASEILVELTYESSQCSLRIKDNGQGFESSLLSISQGFGLLGMTERAERIKAELTIQSHPGQGTEIVVRVQTS